MSSKSNRCIRSASLIAPENSPVRQHVVSESVNGTDTKELGKGTDASGGRADRGTALLLYAGLALEVLAVLIDKSSITNPYQSLMFRAAFVLFALRCLYALIRRIYSIRELAAIAAAMAVCVICWRCSGRDELIRYLTFVCALRTVNITRALKFVFYMTLSGCAVIVALSMTGVMGHRFVTMDYGSGLETRWDLGFGHPNSLHCMALMLMLLGLYLYERYMKLYLYALLFVGNLLLYSLTKSNTAFLVGTGALLLSLLLHYSRRLSGGRFLYVAGELFFAAGLAFSVFAATHSTKKDMRLLDFDRGVLSGRITALWETIFHEGSLSTWKLFGSPLNTYYFDLGWVRVVYWYGIIPAAAVVALAFILLRRIRRRHDRAAFVMLVCMVLYTVLEAHLVSEFIGRNYALFLAALYLPEIINRNDRLERP